ncbi:hypothetical protein F5B20DRAFT_596496 [Whalleya microplaca]|nr:hypothetical protein F5B20DRAFT_596496 [Whalleya microplaca]
MPDTDSASSLGSTNRRFRDILHKYEHSIAYGIVSTMLGDTNPQGIKLAFMAAEAHLLDQRNLHTVSEFLDKYAHRRPWDQCMYRMRAAAFLSNIHGPMVDVLRWMEKNYVKWPLREANKHFTNTEMARQKRIIFARETGFRLLVRPHETDLEEELSWDALAEKFWKLFSAEETHSFHVLSYMLAHHAELEGCFVLGDGLPEPIELATARNTLISFHELPLDYQPEPTSYGVWCVSHSLGEAHEVDLLLTDVDVFVEQDSCMAFRAGLPPFVNDSLAYYNEDTIDWVMDETWKYFEPPHDVSALHQWYFLVGDEDRCESVIAEGAVWEENGTVIITV